MATDDPDGFDQARRRDVTESNARAVADLIPERRADVDRLRGSEDG